jgi:hypothetical protein
MLDYGMGLMPTDSTHRRETQKGEEAMGRWRLTVDATTSQGVPEADEASKDSP